MALQIRQRINFSQQWCRCKYICIHNTNSFNYCKCKGLITSISQQTIRSATTAQTGVVQLVDDLTTNDASKALTVGKTTR
jgi:hypothetical protein